MEKKIQVHIRIRTVKHGIWSVAGNTMWYTAAGKQIKFDAFDSILHGQNNLEIYSSTVKGKIERFNNGENVTIFGYGQTGSGKTHTIIGGDEPGFIRMTLFDIFPADLELSFVELFNERIIDLWTGKELKMYSKGDGIVVAGMTRMKISSPDTAWEFVEKCINNRSVGKTTFNTHSSRSHAILQIRRGGSILTLIDLAGSERACNDEKRAVEASFINRSLLALGKMVNNLLNGYPFGFRDSKLTRFLQETVTRKANILAFCMLNPSEECLAECLSTLNFAARLSNLSLRPTEIQEKAAQIVCSDGPVAVEQLVLIQSQRIDELEKMITALLEQSPNDTQSQLFVLEKQLYKICIENIKKGSN